MSLVLLNDNKIAFCSDIGTLSLLDPFNDYHYSILVQNSAYPSFCQLNDGTLVYTCQCTTIINIGTYSIKNAHVILIYKVITLSNNRIATGSADSTIKIWKSDPPYSDTPIKVLVGHLDWVTSMIYVKEKDLLISGSCDLSIRFWSMKTYQRVCSFRYLSFVRSPNALYQIDNERIIVGSNIGFVIINFDKCVVENFVGAKNQKGFDCFIKLRDNKTILCGCDKGKFGLYDMYTKTFTITNKSHNSTINDILTIDEETFLTCSNDKSIKVWKY